MHQACTLGAGVGTGGRDFSKEGLPSNSGDGKLMVIPCYAQAAGTRINASSSAKTIALVDASAVPDTRILFNAYGGGTGVGVANEYRQVTTATGVSFYLAGHGFAAASSGYLYLSSRTSTVPIGIIGQAGHGSPGHVDPRGVQLLGTQLYGASSSASEPSFAFVYTIGAGGAPPVRATTTAAWAAPGTDSSINLGGFLVETTVSIWVTQSLEGSPPGTLVNYARQGSKWGLLSAYTISHAAISSLAGRVEGTSGFVVYAVTSKEVFRYVAKHLSAQVIYEAPTRTEARGVMFAPYRPPSSTPTLSHTRSPTRTRSATKKAKGLRV